MSFLDRYSATETAERSRKIIEQLAEELIETNSKLLFEIERDKNLLAGLVKREKEADRLERKIAELQRELKETKDQLTSLRIELRRIESCKSVILQRKYWKMRSQLEQRIYLVISETTVKNQLARLKKLKEQACKAQTAARKLLDKTKDPNFVSSLVTGVDLSDEPINKKDYLLNFQKVKEPNEKKIAQLLEEASRLPKSRKQNWNTRRDVKIGIISDEFFYESIEAAADFVPLSPIDFREKLPTVELLLVVSTWRGINNEWAGVANKNNRHRLILETELIPHAKELGIPVVFYSKEDPPNFDLFLSIASLSDFVFTSAEEMIPKYRSELDSRIPVNTLTFGVNYRYHNPLGCQRYSGKEVVFAGSWLSHKYPDRAEAAAKIFDGVNSSDHDLILLDRNLNLDTKKFKNAERYLYPYKYLTNLHGPLPHDEVLRLQKLLPVSINLNSVTTSQSMFANRVVELLAMGTFVLSNYSPGINSKYPYVSILTSAEDTRETLSSLTPSFISYSQIQGIRDVFLTETCFDKIDQVLTTVGISFKKDRHRILVVSESAEKFDAFVDSQETEFQLAWISPDRLKNLRGSDDGDLLVFLDRLSLSDPNLINDIVVSMRYSDAKKVELLPFDSEEQGFEFSSLDGQDHEAHAIWLDADEIYPGNASREYLKIKTQAYSSKPKARLELSEEPDISVVVPVYNNGVHLLHKCFRSLLRSSVFKHSRIILVDDGSSSKTTLSVLKTLEEMYSNVTVFRFPEGGSGSASRPRNKGLELVETEFVTYLDPDNEQTNDAYERLLRLVKKNNRDFAIGNMIRLGTTTTVNSAKFLKNALTNSKPMNGQNKSLLEALNYRPMSIQALVARTSWLKSLNLIQPIGAVGQDSYFFQQMLFYAKNIAVTNIHVHIYYAAVVGSTVNSITPNFYRKYLPLESARADWLESVGLINHYYSNRFKYFFQKWYLAKLEQVDPDSREECLGIIRQIVEIYASRVGIDIEIEEMLSEAARENTA